MSSALSFFRINIETALWTIPAPRMKGGAAHEVPLWGLALEIIKSLPRFAGAHMFSRQRAASGP
jgi:hypothetical protein